MSEHNNNDPVPKGGLSPLPGAHSEPKLGHALVKDSILPDFQQKFARPRNPSEEYQDKLSVSHEAQKGADSGGIISLDEQVDNGSAYSSNFLPSGGEGGGATNGDVGDAQICNVIDDVPEGRTESEDMSNNISGSERLSRRTRTLPASERKEGNFGSQNLPDQEVRKERNESESESTNISGSERLSRRTRTLPASEDEAGNFESQN